MGEFGRVIRGVDEHFWTFLSSENHIFHVFGVFWTLLIFMSTGRQKNVDESLGGQTKFVSLIFLDSLGTKYYAV